LEARVAVAAEALSLDAGRVGRGCVPTLSWSTWKPATTADAGVNPGQRGERVRKLAVGGRFGGKANP
jgi:hypothetical protein